MKAGERLVGEARERRSLRMPIRERLGETAIASGFVLTAAIVANTVPWNRPADPLLIAALAVLLALVSRVEFEVGSGYAVPEQLVFVPLLFLAPLPMVPLIVAAAFLLSRLPDFLSGEAHANRWLYALSDSWFTIGPVLVLGLLAPGDPDLGSTPVYLLAFLAQAVAGLGPAVLGERLAFGASPLDTLRSAGWSLRIDAILSPIALMVAMAAVREPAVVVVIVPLVWLLHHFSEERKERYAAALELNRAYRGTVMLLSDVVEAEDNYTADHCRSVVELVTSVADELDIEKEARQELEFAALLHDVGKISIPKEILNKPAELTDSEYALMKTHTVEGQLLLDRVGGLLARVGAIVRSCHERWDGAGYPDGLAEREIPVEARIVFTCDAYNAMTTNRPYRRAMSMETALEELWANAGKQFDPLVVTAVSNVVRRQNIAPERSPVDAVRSVLVSRQGSSQVEAAG